MSNDKDKLEGAADGRPNRPTTIDLKAGEFTSETTRPDVSPAAEERVTQDADAREDPAAPPQPRSERAGGPPWSVIGIAAAASAVFFVIGFFASQWLAGRALLSSAAVPPAQLTQGPDLTNRLAKVEAALASTGQTDPQLLARIAAAEAAVKTAADIAATRDRRGDEIAAIARDARDKAANAVTAAEAAQKSGGANQPRTDIEAVNNRLAALEQTARSNQTEINRKADDADGARSRLAIASIALRNAVDSGSPFGAELSAVKAHSSDPRIAALEPFAGGGVPTAATLGRELAALMPSIWKAAQTQDAPQGSFLERLQANAGKIVRIRPSGEVAGDDPANIKARLERRAETDDIRGALAELAKLAPDARAPAKGWIAKAEARQAAVTTARDLAQGALNALAKSGS